MKRITTEQVKEASNKIGIPIDYCSFFYPSVVSIELNEKLLCVCPIGAVGLAEGYTPVRKNHFLDYSGDKVMDFLTTLEYDSMYLMDFWFGFDSGVINSFYKNTIGYNDGYNIAKELKLQGYKFSPVSRNRTSSIGL